MDRVIQRQQELASRVNVQKISYGRKDSQFEDMLEERLNDFDKEGTIDIGRIRSGSYENFASDYK
jgi:hypothetical protein